MMLLSLPVVLLLSFTTVHVNGQTEGTIVQPNPEDPCTVCFSGEAPITEPGFKWFTGETNYTCGDIITAVFDANITQGIDTCKDYQLLAFQIGCCTSPPYEYCTACPDGSDYTRSNEVPIGATEGTNPTCAENIYRVASYNSIFDAGTCADTVIQRGAFYCDCPNTAQQCFLCPDESPPDNPERGDAWITNSNCQGLEFLFSLYNTDECEGLRNDYGVDFAHFCKCPNYVKPSNDTCVLCSGGLQNPDFVYATEPFERTCQQASDFAESITRENICVREAMAVFEQGCICNGGGNVTFQEGSGSSASGSGSSSTMGTTTMFSIMIAAVYLALNLLLA